MLERDDVQRRKRRKRRRRRIEGEEEEISRQRQRSVGREARCCHTRLQQYSYESHICIYSSVGPEESVNLIVRYLASQGIYARPVRLVPKVR